jgi:hypothetical protein
VRFLGREKDEFFRRIDWETDGHKIFFINLT